MLNALKVVPPVRRSWLRRLAMRIVRRFGPTSMEFCEELRHVDESGFHEWLRLVELFRQCTSLELLRAAYMRVSRQLVRMSDAGVTPEGLEHLLRAQMQAFEAAVHRICLESQR